MHRVLLDVPEPAPERVRVEGERFHHLVHVLRLEAGATVEAFDGKGRAWDAKVSRVDDDALELLLGAPLTRTRGPTLTLIQGLPKGDKLEWILQKGTEVGADVFRPVATRRAVVKLSGERAQERAKRWAKICEEAARQCGRSLVPAVHPPVALEEAVAALPPGTSVLVLDEEERAVPLRDALAAAGAGAYGGAGVALVVGPEGGLEREEVARLVAGGARAVTLGRNVLRTETAALVALALVRFTTGELG